MGNGKQVLMALVAVMAAIVGFLAGADEARADIVATRVVNGRTYYVDVVKRGDQAEVWLRVQRNASSIGDMKGLTITRRSMTKAATVTLTQAAQTVCTVKAAYENGKTILGCAATVTTGVCVVAAVPSGGTSAVVCEALASYTLTKGLADCIDGVSELIVTSLVGDSNWNAYMAGYSLSSAQWSSAINRAIDAGCANIR